MMLQVSESAGLIKIDSPMRPGLRVVLGLVGLLPLLAPYELIFRVDWDDYLNPFFFVAAAVSLGAMAVSSFFFFAAVAGLSTRMVFDTTRSTFSHSATSPFRRLRTRSYPLSAVDRLRSSRTHDGSRKELPTCRSG